MVLSVTVVRAVTEGWGQGFPQQLSKEIRGKQNNKNFHCSYLIFDPAWLLNNCIYWTTRNLSDSSVSLIQLRCSQYYLIVLDLKQRYGFELFRTNEVIAKEEIKFKNVWITSAKWVIPKTILTVLWMAFCNSKGNVRGWGEVELEIRRCGEILRIGIQRHEGLDLEFPQGTDKSVFLENAYFMALINANKVQTDGTGGC